MGPNRKDRFAINEDLPTITTTSKIAIIGAGFGGMAGAIKTMNKYDEHDIQIFERHDNFGGTWYANTYPGCASDIPAFWYSFSFALTSNWSRIQPPQYEMEEYLLRIAEQYKLKEKQDSKLKSIKLNGMTLVVNGLCLHTMLKLVKESFTKVSFYLPVKVV